MLYRYVDEMLQELNSCLYQLAYSKTDFIICTSFHLKSQNLLTMVSENLTVIV